MFYVVPLSFIRGNSQVTVFFLWLSINSMLIVSLITMISTGNSWTINNVIKNKIILKSSRFINKRFVSIESHRHSLNITPSTSTASSSNIIDSNINKSNNKIYYKIKQHDLIYEETIKKSKFIAYAMSVDTIDDALKFIEQVKDSKASHNCWAYRSSSSSSECIYRYSDDGEPSGTAGKPILQAIEGEDVVDIVLVVTRYYGGIKLGTGGLTRAYGSVAKALLSIAEKYENVAKTTIEIVFETQYIGNVYQILHQYQDKFIKVYEDYIHIDNNNHNEDEDVDDYSIKEEKEKETNEERNYGNSGNHIDNSNNNDSISSSSSSIKLIGPTIEIDNFKSKLYDNCKGKITFTILTTN